MTRTGLELGRAKRDFSLLYFLLMWTGAMFGPFATVYFSGKGFSADVIGRISGANSLVIILVQPLWGMISDRVGSQRKTMLVCMVLQIGSLAALWMTGSALLPVALCYLAYTAFTSPQGMLLDTWSLRSMKSLGDSNAVGQLKLAGCIAFAACSALSGVYIRRFSVSAILPPLMLFIAVMALFLLRVKTGENAEPRAETPAAKGRFPVTVGLVVFLVYIFLMQLPHRASYTFYPLLMETLGGDSSHVGYASMAMFISQAVVMLSLKRLLGRFKPIQLITASAISFVLWHLMLLSATSPYHVVVACLMDGPSFALFTMGIIYYIDSIAPDHRKATFQMIFYSVYYGLSGVAGNSLGGLVIERWGYKAMYSGGIALILVSTLLYLAYSRLAKATPAVRDRSGRA